MPLDRPIPALYSCYLLRSTIRHSSLYIGSTPNPVRRLRQHNGVAKGGAARTSRDNLRPWEMAVVVSGFPSSIAALQFEWAWQNNHLTRHIPDSLRLTIATEKKRSGHPKRPRYTLVSLLSNLLVLLRVPSFSRWPLEVRFFALDAHMSWLQIGSQPSQEFEKPLNIVLDFPPQSGMTVDEDLHLRSAPSQHFDARGIDRPPESASHGIASMPVTYAPYKSYVEKAKTIIDFEQEGKCGVCDEELGHGKGIYAVCPNTACNTVSHLSCLSNTFLGEESTEQHGCESGGNGGSEQLVPISGTCKGCGQTVKWIDVVKEVTLRIRGAKAIKSLLKKPRRNAGTERKRKKDNEIIAEDGEVGDPGDSADDSNEDDGKDDLHIIDDDAHSFVRADSGDQWCTIDDSDDDMSSITSTNSAYASPARNTYWSGKEDNDWNDALVLD